MVEEQEFIKLFSELKATRPPQQAFDHAFWAVTAEPANRYRQWMHLWNLKTASALTVLIVAVGLYAGYSQTTQTPEREILSMEQENQSIADSLTSLDYNVVDLNTGEVLQPN